MVYTALGTALICVCAWITIYIPMTPLVPFTLQTFAIFTVAGLLSLKAGTLSVLIYILLGAVGVPVFSGFKGSLAVLVGPTGGYIVGFLLTALVVGILKKLFGRKMWTLVWIDALGLFVCYLFGSLWFILYSQSNIFYVLSVCVFPFLLPDALKIFLSAFLVNRLQKRISLS